MAGAVTRRVLTAVTATMSPTTLMTADPTMTAVKTARAARVTTGVIAAPTGHAVTAEELLRRRADLPAGHPGRAVLRTHSIEAGLPLARNLAARYQGRGEPLDDLRQVAALALVNAVDGYDPTRQVAFTSYAVPTIIGALKRHFRDTTWLVRMPRRLQELAVSLGTANADLAQQLGRSPTSTELAVHVGATEDDVAVAVRSWQFRHPESLDRLSALGGDDRRPAIKAVGIVDAGVDTVINRRILQPLLAALPVRERRILAMRFLGDLTQAEIAVEIGVSQMHISRLLTRTLTQLRTGILDDPPAPGRIAATPGNPRHGLSGAGRAGG
jgi:RNA polymerase sigma-B factor